MTETYLYISQPASIHDLRAIIGSEYPASTAKPDVFMDDETIIEIEWDPSGNLVERDMWSSDGPYLEEVACWGRIRVTSTDGDFPAESSVIFPFHAIAGYLNDHGIPFRWLDPFQQKVNDGFDLFDVMEYFEAAEAIKSLDTHGG